MPVLATKKMLLHVTLVRPQLNEGMREARGRARSTDRTALLTC